MSVRETAWPDGTPAWIDVAVDDVGAARLFYEGLFGWTVEAGAPEFGGYANCSYDGKRVCGIAPKMNPQQPSAWSTYFATSDAAATMARVRSAGGQVVVEPMAVGDLGTMAVALDPTGAGFGVWQAGTHTGCERVNEPGTLIWNEYLSRDWEAAKAFYSAVFGWTYNDMPTDGARYATFAAADGREVGGIGEFSADESEPIAAWRVYFAADDTDAVLDRAIKLGGSVLRPATDAPYGRMAMVADDQGARFVIISAPQQAAQS